jgi:hypothetical protein
VSFVNRFAVVLDACVLYSAPVRDLILWMAAEHLFRPRWTQTIHEEWITGLLKKRPDLERGRLERLRQKMDEQFPDANISGHEGLIEAITLPDPNDRHVLAAAIVANVDAIVTFNIRDFPRECVAQYELETVDTDDFVLSQFEISLAAALSAAKNCRANRKHPPKSADEYIDTLRKHLLPQTANELRKYREFI